jgi:hypothetical protein
VSPRNAPAQFAPVADTHRPRGLRGLGTQSRLDDPRTERYLCWRSRNTFCRGVANRPKAGAAQSRQNRARAPGGIATRGGVGPRIRRVPSREEAICAFTSMAIGSG